MPLHDPPPPVIYLDVHDVCAPWMRECLRLVGREELYAHPDLDRQNVQNSFGMTYPQLVEIIDAKGITFWSEMKPFAHYGELFRAVVRYGELRFVTDPRDYLWAPRGMMLWFKKNAAGAPYYITSHRRFLAQSNTILIDDNRTNVREFIQNGGHAIHFNPLREMDMVKDVESLLKLFAGNCARNNLLKHY